MVDVVTKLFPLFYLVFNSETKRRKYEECDYYSLLNNVWTLGHWVSLAVSAWNRGCDRGANWVQGT